MYRIGRKQKRAILTEDGHEVVVFAKGKEEMAERVCRLLNAEMEVNKISSNPVVIKSVYEHKRKMLNADWTYYRCEDCNERFKAGEQTVL